jgi:hypothetical protein
MITGSSGYKPPEKMKGQYKIQCSAFKINDTGTKLTLQNDVIRGPKGVDDPAVGRRIPVFLTINFDHIENDWYRETQQEYLWNCLEGYGIVHDGLSFDEDDFVNATCNVSVDIKPHFQTKIPTEEVTFFFKKDPGEVEE